MVQLTREQVRAGCCKIWARMERTKTLPADVMETPLSRCLTTLDITLLGIGHMVGAGIYVLTGTVVREMAGPAITISFLLAGLVCLLSALCYAEFGARVPKAGSSYVYTYVTLGEFWAFLTGWTIVLEHLIAASSVARAWSGYLDTLLDGAMSNSTLLQFKGGDFLASYMDPLAFCICLVCSCLLAVGVKSSTYFNSIFTMANMFVITFFVVVGLFWADASNWNTEGGFAPFGISGVIAGAGTVFYAFAGFETVTTSSEEAANPSKSIPIALFASLSVVTGGYFLVGATVTLMVPYYDVNPTAALADAFTFNGVTWAKYIVSIGAVCGMTTSLFGSLYSLSRCIYGMASDGLLFAFLAELSEKTQVPVINVFVGGIFSGLIAFFIDIQTLVEFMSIGTLLAYTIVSASVIIIRYRPEENCSVRASNFSEVPQTPLTPAAANEENAPNESTSMLRPKFDFLGSHPGVRSGQLVPWFVLIYTFASLLFFFLVVDINTSHYKEWRIAGIVLTITVMLLSIFIILIHRQNNVPLSFKAPCVPMLPLLAVLCNVGLMVNLNPMTWARLLVWMTLGLVIYFFYGIRHSVENEPISAYSTLVTRKGSTGATVFSAVQGKVSQLSSKILPGGSSGQPSEEDSLDLNGEGDTKS